MKVKTITTATDVKDPGFIQFKRSLDKFGWDYDINSDNYLAYGSKMLNAYNYAKQTDATHLFILDAYDIVVIGTVEEALYRLGYKDGIVFNAEKGCWPRAKLAGQYPQTDSDWKYLNGGAAFVEKNAFIRMFEENPIRDKDNDQEKLTDIFLNKRNQYGMQLDNDCKAFQSIAFQSPDDFGYSETRLFNLKTLARPIIIHGNGKTSMDRIYKLLD